MAAYALLVATEVSVVALAGFRAWTSVVVVAATLIAALSARVGRPTPLADC
jgi:hypothetical protein